MKTRPAMPSWAHWDGDDLLLQLRLQPRASSDGFAEPHGDQIRLRVKAPPVDGKANAYLVALLSGLFGVAKRAVVVEKGRFSRLKRVRIVRPARFPPEIQR